VTTSNDRRACRERVYHDNFAVNNGVSDLAEELASGDFRREIGDECLAP